MKELLERAKKVNAACARLLANVNMLSAEKFMAIPVQEFQALEGAAARALEAVRRFAAGTLPPGATASDLAGVSPEVADVMRKYDHLVIALATGNPAKYSAEDLSTLEATLVLMSTATRQITDLRRNVVAM